MFKEKSYLLDQEYDIYEDRISVDISKNLYELITKVMEFNTNEQEREKIENKLYRAVKYYKKIS